MRRLLCIAALLLAACGSEEKEDEDTGLSVPNSIVTDANLAPGSLIGFDADEMKSKMESGGEGGFRANYDNDDDDDDEDESCYDKKFADLKIEAKDDRLRVAGSLDFGECFEENFGDGDEYADANFDDYSAESTIQFAAYISCSGQDLGKYDGLAFSEISDVSECDSATEVEVISETKTITKTKGTIKDIGTGDDKYDFTQDYDYEAYNATRTTSGGTCKGKIAEGVISWSNGCVITEREVTNKDTSSIGDDESEGDNVGKDTYQKLVYKDLKEAADSSSPWYAGGGFEVTYQDWAGTVTYSSKTAEPIFEMVKGSETVTGTIKGDSGTTVEEEDDESNSLHMTSPGKSLIQMIKGPLQRGGANGKFH